MMQRPYAAETPRQNPISAANAIFPRKSPTNVTRSRTTSPEPLRPSSSTITQRPNWVRSVKAPLLPIHRFNRAQKCTTPSSPARSSIYQKLRPHRRSMNPNTLNYQTNLDRRKSLYSKILYPKSPDDPYARGKRSLRKNTTFVKITIEPTLRLPYGQPGLKVNARPFYRFKYLSNHAASS